MEIVENVYRPEGLPAGMCVPDPWLERTWQQRHVARRNNCASDAALGGQSGTALGEAQHGIVTGLLTGFAGGLLTADGVEGFNPARDDGQQKRGRRIIMGILSVKRYVKYCIVLAGGLLLTAANCPSGKPSIDRFFVLYDILCGKVKQGVEWKVTGSSTVTLTVRKDDGTTVTTQTVGNSSNGMYDVDVSTYAPGFYEVVLNATNAQGTSTRSVKFLLAGLPGTAGELWYTFNKTVEKPKEGPWMGFATSVPVMIGQGLNDENTTISVSEYVYFRQFRWKPNPLRWADREGCTSPGLWRMNIGQYTKIQTACEKDKAYPFRSDWTVAGDYSCLVNWAPCNFGVKGATTTYTDVEFSLELQAMCK